MNNSGNDNPTQFSNEELLRFLDAGPKILRWPANRELSRESSQPEIARPGCPSAASYMELATGAVQGDQAEELLAHAANCDACGDALARNLSALEGDPSAEEAAAIADLSASRGDWQQRMARELAATPARKGRVFSRSGPHSGPHSLRWRAGLGIAALLLLAAGVAVWQMRSNTPERQLAMAYEQSRTLELRVPEAAFATLRSASHTRGSGDDREPAPLLDARARLARELERSPQNAHWLQLKARADTLEERYDPAADVLDRLLAQGPVTADLLTDAASAYYQRGLVSHNELDRSTALDYLRRADELSPADPLILFNEAIVMEDRGQMMNAVEVWNRYAAVERDPKWAAEGKRKLEALEQTLNKLKSHQSRIEKMLATPQAMDALAADTQKLATLDEELSSYELDKVLLIAYPASDVSSQSSQQARGSPCTELCLAARRILKAVASSLEIQHHDFWLSDLLIPNMDSLPPAMAERYASALQSLARGMREDLTGDPAIGEQDSQEARSLFQQLGAAEGAIPSIAPAARAGEDRAGVEELFALQREVNFSGCRAFAQQLRALPYVGHNKSRYPWMEAVRLITEKVCDDTPETRRTGRSLEMAALHLAEADHYGLLIARTQVRLAADAQNSGDEETAERLTLKTLRELYSADPPTFRILNTLCVLPVIEQDSPRAQTIETYFRESMKWFELASGNGQKAEWRINVVRAEMRIGATKEAENQLRLAQSEAKASSLGKTGGPNFNEAEIFFANSLLERSDLAGAARYLDQVAAHLTKYSDTWGLRTYASARGQLELALGHLDQADRILESEIRSSEGRNVRGGDRQTTAEYAEQDRDLYAELAATWLAQGRSPESILALWERFRLRSRGLPITPCQDDALDCEQTRLRKAQHALGENILVGQVVLLDRVLLYRVDRERIVWEQKPLRRQDVMDGAQKLERAVSSPFTSPETTEKLGERLAESLLPPIPAAMSLDSTLLLEPDPQLQNLSWPVLPTSAGPLGLQYPLAEMRSILAGPVERSGEPFSPLAAISRHPLIVGASVAAGNEPPLPEALQEALSVSRSLHSAQPLLGQQATTANLAKALGSATMIHFAGHALQTVNGTELLLAASSSDDESPWIDGTFLRQHPPRACKLAVLSACATGARETAWNHPLQDIVETLGELGVPEVVATRWQIDSEASVTFMNSFYRCLGQGQSAAMALTSARRVQFSETLYRNPYYWGAYYISGEEISNRKVELHARLQKEPEA